MINFSSLSYRSRLGRLVRLPLRLVPRNLTVRVLQGPLKGRKWVAGAADAGCWLGSYECAKQHAVARALKPGMVFFDVGAHVGFYTLLASVLVNDGRVFAFEPLERNAALLEKHVRLNGITNVTLFRLAVGDRPGTARFQVGRSSSMGKLSADGGLPVEVASLDDLHARGVIPAPDVVKIDVEGAEALVLRGASRLLSEGRPVLFLATHGRQVHGECLDFLRARGYTCRTLTGEGDVADCDELVAERAD
jgi:FkbM family methyltransferase